MLPAHVTPLVTRLFHLVITPIRRHDVVFLLTITAAVSDSGKAGSSVQRMDLNSLRGAEVVRMVDEERHVFTSESEQDQELRGDVRRAPLHPLALAPPSNHHSPPKEPTNPLCP